MVGRVTASNGAAVFGLVLLFLAFAAGILLGACVA